MKILLIFLYFFVTPLFTNNHINVHEDVSKLIKIKLYNSLILDGGVYCDEMTSFDKLVLCQKKVYDDLNIQYTEYITGEFTSKSNGKHTFYKLKLYRISSYLNNERRYILHYKDTQSEAWYRISGYKENDFIHLYNTVFMEFLSKKEILNVVSEWQKSSDLFKEVDFKCLIEGVKKKCTEQFCYTSETLRMHNNLYAPDVDLKSQLSDDTYAIFSKRPYSGTVPFISDKNRKKRYLGIRQ